MKVPAIGLAGAAALLGLTWLTAIHPRPKADRDPRPRRPARDPAQAGRRGTAAAPALFLMPGGGQTVVPTRSGADAPVGDVAAALVRSREGLVGLQACAGRSVHLRRFAFPAAGLLDDPGVWSPWIDLGAPPGRLRSVSLALVRSDTRMNLFSVLILASTRDGTVWMRAGEDLAPEDLGDPAAYSIWREMGRPE